MKHKPIFTTLLLSMCLAIHAYTVAPSCPDFTDIEASYVEAFTGNTNNPFATPGVVTGRHTVITTQGTDPNTGGALQFLPPGESSVVKLGNEQVGAEAEALTYRFMVDKDNPVLLVKFAVVLEDPGHPHIAQPRFVIRITDKNGNLIEDCAEYDVSARPDIPGFQSAQGNIYTPVRWRDWTNVGLDLSRCVGQEVQVQFITYDCDYSGHFGYAYFTASCMPNRLELESCGGSQFTLEAPDNFESYLWSNGSTDRTATFNTPANNNTQISCTVTSATGCQFPLYAFITTNSGGVQTGSFTDIICEGETYTKHNFSLPPQEPGTHFFQNVIVNPQTCSDGQTIELELTVVQRYNKITASICHGQDYTENGFNIINPAVGVRRDTLEKGTTNGCTYYDVLKLTVNANFNMPNVIQGEASPCTKEIFTYTFAGAETLTHFEWILPGNAVLYKSSRYAQTIQVYFTDDTPSILQLSGQNGCGNGTAQLAITPRKTHSIQLNEDICQGENFDLYNFNLGVQDSVGYFVHSKHLTSSLGCDSVVTLALNVMPTPVVRIEPKDAMVCNPGDEITLWALTDSMKQCQDYDAWYNTLIPTAESEFLISQIQGSSGEYGVMSYIGAGGIVVVPSKINTYLITVITLLPIFEQIYDITEIILPPTMEAIGEKAFANNSNLTYVTIPKSVYSIIGDTFDNSPNVIIRCYENSYAHQFAIDNGIKFELMYECNYGSSSGSNNGNINNQSSIPCGDYDKWYNNLTPTDENEFTVMYDGSYWVGVGMFNNSLSGKVVVPKRVGSATVAGIRASGFNGNANITEVVLPRTVSTFSLQSKAFANMPALTYITIPENVSILTADVFENSPNVIIRCYNDSPALLYAQNNGIEYEVIEECTAVSDIPCRDYEEWYDTLTPNAESDFSVVTVPSGVSIRDNISASGKVVVPREINGQPVTSITTNVTEPCRPPDGITELILPPTLTFLGGNLISCRPLLTYVTIPPSVINIYIQDSPNVIFRCYENSYAHQFAVNNNIKFELIEDCESSNSSGETDINIYDCDLNYQWSNGSTEGFITVNPTVTTEYTVTVSTQNGCSSTATQTVVVNTNAPQTIYESICEGEVYTGYGLSETKTGVYPVTIDNGDCSFTLNVDLTVNKKVTTDIIDNVCAGQPYRKHGLDFTLIEPGVFRDTLRFRSAAGCDSIVALEITVLPETHTLLRDSICQNEPYNKNGFNLPVQNIANDFTYNLTATSKVGCDSIVTLKLHVKPVYKNIISDEVLQNGAYNKYNFNFPKVTQDTTAIKNLVSSAGCDSIVTLNLTVEENIINPPPPCYNVITNLTDAICQYQPYYNYGFNLPVQTVSGKFTHTKQLLTHEGCDSIVVLKLTVNKIVNREVKLIINQENPIIIDGKTYTESEIFKQNYLSHWGCDSVVTYVITEYESGENYNPYSDCDPIIPDQWFSPNADMVHDLWLVENIECYDYQIEIYDRYGKLLRRWENNFNGWDGTYNGNPVISDDYWYRIRLKGSGQKDYIGHFNLRR